jgi:hypothetical protein
MSEINWQERAEKAETELAEAIKERNQIDKELCDLDDELEQVTTHLRNLLARIHQDGGHYVALHGLDVAVKSADEILVGRQVTLGEMESAQKQAAAMREALECQHSECATCHPGEPCPDVCVCSCGNCHASAMRKSALFSDAGRDYISRESVKPLVDALRNHHAHASESCNVFFEQDGKAIDIATDLGEAYQDSELCEKTYDALRAFPL